jgi:hypothetical protein
MRETLLQAGVSWRYLQIHDPLKLYDKRCSVLLDLRQPRSWLSVPRRVRIERRIALQMVSMNYVIRVPRSAVACR